MKSLMKMVWAVIMIAVVSLVATAPGVQAKSNTVTYAMYGDVKDWDPSIAFSLEVMMLANVYEPLLWYNPPGSEEQFTPALATSWSVSEDGLSWTFKLREGVKFHDGESFNAAAAKAAIERTKSMKKGAWYIWASVDSIEALDDTTLVIKTKSPQPIDLIASSQYGAYMFSPKAAEKGTDWFNQGNAAGTGPYKVRQWAKGQQIVLEKNADFHGGWSDKNFDRVILKVVTENATQVQMLKAGEADFISLVPADVVDSLNKEEGISAYAVPSWKNSQFLINTQKAPTDNKKFRQALTHIWDYDTVVNDIYAGYADVARGVIPATMWGHDSSIKAPKFDLDMAKKLIEESGVPVDQRKISIAYIGTSEAYKNSVLLFQENARQVGIEVELMPGEWGVIWDKAKNLETAPNMQSMTWWPTYPTPNDWMIGLFRTEEKALFNLSHYTNPAYDKVLDEGVALEGMDRKKAITKYAEAQQILMDDAVAIFYADIKGRTARRSNIEGLETNPAYAAVFFHKLSRK
ncbi:ABC transporter substrate-binding protein [Sneathiella glossodoripedis]|uniref:ABC transporter substrate-binding protein n=1 Tax=Sneathiella glossodoripedis TaxID=418853 RepID=UPI00046F2444|nr:ABC transporter substrate-binding protein [Sneathiella glossodoripedis]